MKKGLFIVVLGLLLAAGGFAGFYYKGMASCREMMRGPQPELAWLKQEFRLGDEEFTRISKLHAAYLPQCAERCRMIEEQNQKLRQLFAQATNMTPEIAAVLSARARLRAACETEMMKHFLDVSRTMPPEQGRRYLAWVQEQTFLHGEAMEARHRMEAGAHAGHQHSM